MGGRPQTPSLQIWLFGRPGFRVGSVGHLPVQLSLRVGEGLSLSMWQRLASAGRQVQKGLSCAVVAH